MAAAAGRMNARGISVFYGANDPLVALSEVRPPVGARVAIARFEIIRPIKLLDLTARARVRTDTALVAKYCREAVDVLVSAHGTSSFGDWNRMQRLWRDVHVASHHAITEWQVNLEIYGKALLGVEPNITPLI